MEKPFSVRRSEGTARTTRLTLEGFLDAYTSPELETAIQAEVDRGECRLVVDGSGLTYISSAGLGVFMGFIEEVREKGGDIKICGLVPKVRQVFELLGFLDVFDVVEETGTAEELFAAGSLHADET